MGSMGAGFIFGVAWLVFVDGIVMNEISDTKMVLKNNAGLIYLPGIMATISLFMVNTVLPEDLNDDQVGGKLKVWLFLSIMIGMTAIIVAVWVLADIYIQKHPHNTNVAAIGALVQTVLIFISALVFWVAKGLRSDSDW